MKLALVVGACLVSIYMQPASAQAGKKTTTTQEAAEAAKRQSETGTMNKNAAKALERIEKEEKGSSKPEKTTPEKTTTEKAAPEKSTAERSSAEKSSKSEKTSPEKKSK